MKLLGLQTIAVIIVLTVFVIWSLAQIADDLFLGNKGVNVPDQFWGLLGIIFGSLLYALRYLKDEINKKNGKTNEIDLMKGG